MMISVEIARERERAIDTFSPSLFSVADTKSG